MLHECATSGENITIYSILQPTTQRNIAEPGQQLQVKGGSIEGTSGVLLVVLPVIAVFIVIILVVLFVTIRHTSRVQRYLFQQSDRDAEAAAQLNESIEMT